MNSFLETAKTRADHLRQISAHMHALDWVTASLHDVEGEIPELEAAMAVYRRLESSPTGPSPAAPRRSTSASRSSSRRPAARRASKPAAPSFKDFARQHLADETGGDEHQPAAGLALDRIQRISNGVPAA